MTRILLALLVSLAAPSGLAQLQTDQEPLVFSSAEEQQRFNALTEELRCLVCQNQNLADSDAPLAHDLRHEIHAMMQTGKSDEEIKRFLIERYGDFVLYRPPVQGNTLVLWFAPVLLLLAGAATVFVSVSRRKRLLANQDEEAAP
jgi:cytochrome c-type biogenesis protein CcmH